MSPRIDRAQHDADAARLVALKDAYYAATRAAGAAAREHTLSGAQCDTVTAAHDAHDVAAGVFRRRYYPRAAVAFASFGEVYVSSPTGRRVRCVYTAPVVREPVSA
jgi:hypothetical protein